MKKLVIGLMVALLVFGVVPQGAYAGGHCDGWGTVGKILTGVFAMQLLLGAGQPCYTETVVVNPPVYCPPPPVVYYPPKVVYAPPVVAYCPPPVVTYCPPPPIKYCPPPVYMAPGCMKPVYPPPYPPKFHCPPMPCYP